LLSALFRLMLVFTYVPNEFGLGLIVPLLKSDDCDSTVADNYRAITISPCISKAFESCLISIRSVVNLPCIDDVLCRRRSVFIKKRNM